MWNWDASDVESSEADLQVTFANPSLVGQRMAVKTQGSFTLRLLFTPTTPGPNTRVPESINVLVDYSVGTYSQGDTRGNTQFSMSLGLDSAVGTPNPLWPIEEQSGTRPGNWGGTFRWKRQTQNARRLLRVDTRGAVRQSNGSYRLELPIGGGWAKIAGDIGTMPSVQVMTPTGLKTQSDQQLRTTVGAGVSANIVDIRAKSPDPNRLAFAPCPDPTPQAPLNQYIVGVPIQCEVTVNVGDATMFNDFKSNLSWSIARPPLPVLPVAPNGAMGSSSGDVYARFWPRLVTTPTPVPSGPTPTPGPTATPAPTATPLRGMNFDTSNGLPSSNLAFGTNSIDHVYKGVPFATAQIALFYNSGAFTHPADGKVTSCSFGQHLLADTGNVNGVPATPNWFFYYMQAWTPPCPVSYDYLGSNGQSYFDPYHPDHVHVTNDSHGAYITPVFEKRPGIPFVVRVGDQMHYGIDNFVAAVTHEATHRRINQMIPAVPVFPTIPPAQDTDGDHLPDALETEAGLNPNAANSSGSGFSDEEVYCKMQELNAEGPRYADWASDGLNWGRTPGLCSQDRHPIHYTR